MPEMSVEEFWFILSEDEKKELIQEQYESIVDSIVSRTSSKTASNWYMRCMRLINGGLDAMRKNSRCQYHSKQQAIKEFFDSKKRKRIKEPNPLSCKKKKPAPAPTSSGASAEAGVKKRRRGRRRAAAPAAASEGEAGREPNPQCAQ